MSTLSNTDLTVTDVTATDINTTNLKNASGAEASTPAEINSGRAKAWVDYNQQTPAVIGSFGVSSVTDNSAGNFTVNFSTAFADTTFVGVTSMNLYNRGSQATSLLTKTTGGMSFGTNYEASPDGNTIADAEVNMCVFFGDQ
tara:strand:+ start:1158 stop:1583 length:426 start_codon:yes stop_codon:yes gene_type:complete